MNTTFTQLDQKKSVIVEVLRHCMNTYIYCRIHKQGMSLMYSTLKSIIIKVHQSKWRYDMSLNYLNNNKESITELPQIFIFCQFPKIHFLGLSFNRAKCLRTVWHTAPLWWRILWYVAYLKSYKHASTH